MGFDFGAFGAGVGPSVAGYLGGQNAAEAEAYKRQQQQEEEQRQIQMDAMRRQLLQSEIDKNAAETSPEALAQRQQQSDAQTLYLRARALGALPDLYAPDQLPGDPTSTPGVKPWWEKRGFKSADDYWAYRNKDASISAAHRRPRAGAAGGEDGIKTTELRQRLKQVANAADGDLGKVYHMVNTDPVLFDALKTGAIKNYDVQGAVRATKRAIEGQDNFRKLVDGAAENPVLKIPAQYRKFPSETPETWVARMKRLGLDAATTARYGAMQGIQ